MLCGGRVNSCALRAIGRRWATSSAVDFSFVGADIDDKQKLRNCRDVLRGLGRQNDAIVLHLPDDKGVGACALHHAHCEKLTTWSKLKRTAFIEIHNEKARNALSGKMMAEFADVVDTLERKEIHEKINCVVLKGHGGFFCAGADLFVAKEELSSKEAGSAMGMLMTDTLTRFRRLPLVTVAAIEGGALGGGAELTTATDFRLLHDQAFIQFVQSRMGVSPGWGGGSRLLKIVGRQQALRLLGTAERVYAQKAMELGLVDNATDVEQDIDSALETFLEPFDSVEPEVLHGAKRVISKADDVSLDEILEYEHLIFKTLWGGPANMRALAGALSKKKK